MQVELRGFRATRLNQVELSGGHCVGKTIPPTKILTSLSLGAGLCPAVSLGVSKEVLDIGVEAGAAAVCCK